MRDRIAAVSLIALVATGCNSLNSLRLKSSEPGPIKSKPPASAIMLSAPVVVNGKKGVTNIFPAGKYSAVYEDRAGYYFEAPTKVIVTDVASFAFEGGLYVPRETTEPTQWYFIGHEGKTMGRFKKIPPHTLIH